jgi:uncharacterized protein YxeA
MDSLYIGIILISLIVMVILIILPRLFRSPDNYKKRQSYVEKHEQYMKVLDYYMEKSFDIIYKDRILVYSIEGTKPDDNIIKQNSIDFAKLTLKLLGSTLTKEFIYLYGDEETFMFTIVEYFNTKAEHDEIKQASIDQIMEGSPNEIV